LFESEHGEKNMVRVQLTISDPIMEILDGFCKQAGASRSGVIEVLISEYLDDLIEKIAKLPEKLQDEDEDEEDEED